MDYDEEGVSPARVEGTSTTFQRARDERTKSVGNGYNEHVHALNLIAPDRFRKLRRVEYEHLAEAGFFRHEKVELLYGRLVAMPPHGRAHAYAIRQLDKVLHHVLFDRATVQVQLPFAALDDSEPEPDVAVLPIGDYLDGHPSAAHLIIEVSDSSLADDRLKGTIYARAGVPEYWIVNLVDQVIERYTDLQEREYRHVSRHTRGEILPIPSFGDLVVAVIDVLPPSP